MDELVFIKWGGSLITNKNQAETPNIDTIVSLASQFLQIVQKYPNTKFVLGHGSGSFGHFVANKYQTRQGVSSLTEWNGFWQVWKAARALNQIVLSALNELNIPHIAIPASATFMADNKSPISFFDEPFRNALQHGILPVIYGDVVFDRTLGGTILSTEDLFLQLARSLRPNKILLAGLTDAIFYDFPKNKQRIPIITPHNFKEIEHFIGASNSIDVTGGMISKVKRMLEVIEEQPQLQVTIFSGMHPDAMQTVLQGDDIGTSLRQE
ncbi:MAG: hypothetical protein BGO78_00555 [Chloroflexi bacterium 44-23]|nr:MAG: hypothetical protein BGO78_00555 [Chloroflexi bacterium 44-23]